MNKLSELAELLNSAKQSSVRAMVPEPQPEPVTEAIVNQIQNPVPVKPVSIKRDTVSSESFAIKAIQQDMVALKKLIEESRHRYQPMYTSSGGGVDSTSDIHRPTKTIYANYMPTARDWYIGVGNRDSIVEITLPATKNGREYVIKDESGIAQLVPIRIIGTIDNDPDGIELRINHGSITLLYHNGWRII
jgi:hypothetical protein